MLEDVTVEMQTAEASTTIINVKIETDEGAAFMCTVPQLEWISVETEQVRREEGRTIPPIILYYA